jgi:hypothetical protein
MSETFPKPGEVVQTDALIAKEAMATWSGATYWSRLFSWRRQAILRAELEILALLEDPTVSRQYLRASMHKTFELLWSWGLKEDGTLRGGPT